MQFLLYEHRIHAFIQLGKALKSSKMDLYFFPFEFYFNHLMDLYLGIFLRLFFKF